MMTLRKLILSTLITVFLGEGCVSSHAGRDEMIGQINVFGIQLFSDVDYREINGVVATEEPCLRGYERNFDALDIIIGYGFDKRIRKINTRNTRASLFGIHPGAPFEEGKQKILQAGFKEDISPFRFRADGYLVTFLIDEKKQYSA